MAENSKEKKKNKIMLEVVTPYRHFYEGQVSGVVMPSLDGDLGVLPGHAPLVVALTPGHLEITIDEDKRYAVLTEVLPKSGSTWFLLYAMRLNGRRTSTSSAHLTPIIALTLVIIQSS